MRPFNADTEPRTREPLDLLLWLRPGEPYAHELGEGTTPPTLAGLSLDLAGREPLVWPVTALPPDPAFNLMVRPTQADEWPGHAPGFKVYGVGYFLAEPIRTDDDGGTIRQLWRVTAGTGAHLVRMLVGRFTFSLRVAGRINPPCPLTFAARRTSMANDVREWHRLSAALLLSTLEGIRND